MTRTTPTYGRQSLLLIALFGLGLLITACDGGKKSPDDSKVLATVNDEAITEKDYLDYLKLRQTQQAPIPDKDKEKKVVLDEMVNRVLLVQNAVKSKVDEEADVYFQIKRQRENVLARAMVRKFLKDTPITDDDVKARYTQEIEKTHKTEYRARHILTETEAEARDIVTQLNKGASFTELAKKKSIDVRSGKEGGDLGWFNQGAMVPEFFDAVVALKKGETAKEPVKSDFGWHIIKVEDSRPLKIPPFDQIKPNIRQLVQQEKIDAMVKDLKDKSKVKINE